MAASVGVKKKQDDKAGLCHPNLFFCFTVVFLSEECFSSITGCVVVFDPV